MLKDKVTIVTGAASGIGLSVAQEFAKDGAKVVMADVSEAKLKEESEKIGQSYFPVDLTKREGCRGLVDFTLEKFKRVDILVNVAGVQTVAPIDQFPEDRWDFIIALMLTAPFNLTKYVWPSMKQNGWGRIINLNSIHGLVASEFKSAYVSAKHGLMGLTKTTGLEGGPFGITVNSICPSYVRTPLVDNQIADQAKSHGISEEEVVSNIMLVKSSIKKLLEPKTVADVAKFLCSPAADSITGAAIPVDGGWTAG
ncbi:MAG: 3-hydroxybutyrate dehydrogenase [Synergistaceae bacterium]|jgi:3-hydroxybutyrate dehydrogenase|nr:3-hydroxybutyrate dehydrogenase [Synergistaceae bacterium]